MTRSIISTKKSEARATKLQTPLIVDGDGVVASSLPAVLESDLKKRVMNKEARHAMIAEAAYLKAAQRGFMPGNELADWLDAEAEFDAAPNG